MSMMTALRHPKEGRYLALLMIFSIPVWALIVIGVGVLAAKSPSAVLVPLAELGLFMLVMLLGAAFYRAYILGHHVLIGPTQFPHLLAMVEDGARRLGLPATPRAFVYNSNGVLNAFAMRLVGSPYVMVASSLIDAETDAQVRFVIGHELGHHAAGHLKPWKNLLTFPGKAVPFLGPAYHRARELTADRVGAFLSGDLDASRGALAMLACGSARLNEGLNRDAFQAQEAMVPAFFGFVLKAFSGYPRLTTRVASVSEYFAQNRGEPAGMARGAFVTR